MTRKTIAILVLAALPFLPALGGEFVYDDVALCVEDSRIASGDLIEAVLTPYWGARPGGLYRPVTTLSYVLNARVSREPFGFRLVNVLLHAGASVLALELARRLLRSERAAFLAAAIFAVHPLHVEVAGNVVGRAESLGFLLAGSAWLLAVPAARARRPGPLLAAAALAVLGLLAKENALGVALGAPLEVLFWPLAPAWGKSERTLPSAGPRLTLGQRVDAVALAAVPAVVGLALAVAARLAILGPNALTPGSKGIPWVMNPLVGATLSVRLANAPLLLIEYARHFVWPVALAPDYAGRYLPLATSAADRPVIGWCLGAFLLIVGPALATRSRVREMAFASAFALLSLGPVLQIVPIGTLLGDRLAYAASFGWALVAGVGGQALMRWCRGARDGRSLERPRLFDRENPWGRLGAGLVLGLLAAVATADALAWRSNIPLFERAYARTHGTLQIPLVLGSFYNQAGRYEEARGPLRAAIKLNPEDGGPHLVLGNAERLAKNYRVAREELERGLSLPHLVEDDSAARYDLGDALLHLGDVHGAEREFRKASVISPDAKGFAALGGVLFLLEDWEKSRAALEKSLSLDPKQEKAAEVAALLEKCLKKCHPQ